MIIYLVLECPRGWYDGQYGSCYKFVNTGKSWYNGKTTCSQLGGTLAIIDTQAEAEELQLLRKNTGKKVMDLIVLYYYSLVNNIDDVMVEDFN